MCDKYRYYHGQNLSKIVMSSHILVTFICEFFMEWFYLFDSVNPDMYKLFFGRWRGLRSYYGPQVQVRKGKRGIQICSVDCI